LELTDEKDKKGDSCAALSKRSQMALFFCSVPQYRYAASAGASHQIPQRRDAGMLQIQTANLPQNQQQRLHPDFLANEQAYLQMRDSLCAQHQGQWVAVHGGKVLAAGAKLLEVMEKASASTGHPYIALVGAEDAVVFRVRRVAFAYDLA
jgi:hypothetical protein